MKIKVQHCLDLLERMRHSIYDDSSSYCEDSETGCDLSCPAYNKYTDGCMWLELNDVIDDLRDVIYELEYSKGDLKQMKDVS